MMMPCRPRQPWEASDGAVYLLRQLVEVVPQEVTPLLPLLAHIAALKHFPQARNLQETIWKQLGPIMLILGKKVCLWESSPINCFWTIVCLQIQNVCLEMNMRQTVECQK